MPYASDHGFSIAGQLPSTESPAWVTNNAEAAKALKAADVAYEKARAAAHGLSLRHKVDAYRKAAAARDAAYRAVVERAR